MTFISRLCTRRVPPEAIRALPISLDTSVRRLTVSMIVASSWSISWRRSSMSGTGSVSIVIGGSSLCGGYGLIRFRASHKRRAPDPEADRGALGKQLDHGHRWPVPVKKSAMSRLREEHRRLLLNEHENECATNSRAMAKSVAAQR